MKKAIIIVLLILQILFVFIVFIFNPPILITINNDEFNELLMNNTYYGFPESSFIIAIVKENWFRPKTCEIILFTGYNTYKLQRSSDNVIRYYIKNHSNYRIISIINNLVMDFIVIIIARYKKINIFLKSTEINESFFYFIIFIPLILFNCNFLFSCLP